MEARLVKSLFSEHGIAAFLFALSIAASASAQPPGQGQPPAPSPEEQQSAVAFVRGEIAQRAAEQARAAIEGPIRMKRHKTTVVYPAGLSGVTLTGGSILATKEAKTVSIAAAFPVSDLSEIVLKASAPLSEDEPRSATMQLDGLADKAKVGVEWRYGQQRLPDKKEAAELTSALFKACTATNPTAQRAPDGSLEIVGCDLARLSEVSPQAKDLIARWAERESSWYLTLKADVGSQNYKFADATTFKDAEQQEYPTSVNGVFGYLTGNNVYLAGSLRYDHTFEAAKTQAVCSISALDKQTACPGKVVGPPSPKNQKVFEVEARSYVRDTGASAFGVSAILRHDWEQKNTSFEVPLYFIKDKDGGLSGGISTGYVWADKPEDTGPRFTVFVGQTFGLGGGR